MTYTDKRRKLTLFVQVKCGEGCFGSVLTVTAVQAGLGAHLDFLFQVLGDEVSQVSFVADRPLELQSRGDCGPSAL